MSAYALVVAAAFALAFAPFAGASHTTEVTVESATLGPGGSVTVSGTIECTTDYVWFVSTTLRQKSGKVFNIGTGFAEGTCSTTGPEPYTTNLFFGQGPFRSGRAVVEAFAQVCDPSFVDCAFDTEIAEIRIRR